MAQAMTSLREISSRCEAKLHAFRRTQDGVVVSFVVHPAEVPPVLALDPLGTRYMLAFAAIGDDEQPLPASQQTAAERPPIGSKQAAGLGGPEPIGAGVHTEKSERAKAAYRDMTAGEQAVCRAGRLPKDERFLAWVTEILNNAGSDYGDVVSEEVAARFIRSNCCGHNSRKLIAEVPEYMDRFLSMELEFKIAVGEAPEIR